MAKFSPLIPNAYKSQSFNSQKNNVFSDGLVASSISSEIFTVNTVDTNNMHRFIYNSGSRDFFNDSDNKE